MRSSTAITTAIAVAACLLVLFWQSRHIAALEARSRMLQQGDTSGSERGTSLPKKNSATQRHADRAAQETDSAVVPTAADLRVLWPSGIDLTDPTSVAIAIPKLVEAVENCTPAQLLRIAGELVAENRRRSDRLVTKLLLILAAEDDPEEALAFWDEHHQSIDTFAMVRSALLSQLAKKDMALAREKIERDALDPNDLRRGRIAVAQELFKSDIAAGLEILRKGAHCDPCMVLNGLAHGHYDSSVAVQVAARDPQVAANLWREANRLESGSERSILLGGLIEKEAVGNDIAAVAEAFAKIDNLTAEERDRLLVMPILYGRRDDPAGTIALIREHAGTDAFRAKKVVDTFQRWMKAHPGEASAWLGVQPASPDRDQMTVQLVEQIANSDPAAAAAWVREISDEGLRAKTVERVEEGGGGVSPGR